MNETMVFLLGAMAGASNAILASPGACQQFNMWSLLLPFCTASVEMFKVRMQGQYGAATDKRLRDVASEMWSQWGLRKGIMRGYWVITV